MAFVQAAPALANNTATLATILPANTPMPLHCDACEYSQNYTMTHLRQLPIITCTDCGDTRQFSAFELTVLERTLNTMGYFLQKRI